jgi:PIN domain nuclease of toxin-antitoxin system
MKRSRSDSSASSVRLLLDTQLLVWIVFDDRRISRRAAEAVRSPDNSLHVSAAVAFEFADLQKRGRFPITDSIDVLSELIGFSVADLPAETWRIAATLPDLHRDPVDRMMIAHAILGGFTLVTADRTMRAYPVTSLW